MVHEPDYPIRGHLTVQKGSLLAPISRRSRGRCARSGYHRHGFAQASVAESAITLPPVTPGSTLMPLTRFLQDVSFRPEEIAVLVAVYEAALRELDLTGHTDPGAETLARGAFSVRGL